MALIVEDGSIVAGAISFISLADAGTYHSTRGNAAWAAATSDARTAALIQATDYLCFKYLVRWKGAKVRPDQPLCWPRMGAVDEDGWWIGPSTIPDRLKNATAEAALRALSGQLAPDETREVVRQMVAGAVDTTYRAGSPLKSWPQIDMLLAGLLKGTGVTVQLA